MIIAVRLNDSQKEEWVQKSTGTASVHFINSLENKQLQQADVLIDLLYAAGTIYPPAHTPSIVLVNAVTASCASLPPGFIRINAWPGFLQRPVTELAARNAEEQQLAAQVMAALGWEYCFTPDIPGFITAPVVAMIINEAWYALEEQVSTKAEIDTAMKLGTNYPYGPFEWCSKIGADNILALLHVLSHTNTRYKPAPLLIQSADLPQLAL